MHLMTLLVNLDELPKYVVHSDALGNSFCLMRSLHKATRWHVLKFRWYLMATYSCLMR